jgi:hypothetical protein
METPFKQSLIDAMKAKGLAETSITTYVRNLEKLNDNLPLRNMNFLKDVPAIKAQIEKYKDNTQRNYLISIVAGLSTGKGNTAKKLYNQYHKIMLDKAKELKQTVNKNEKTETQRENWVTWDDVKNKFEEYKTQVSQFIKKKEINEHQYNILLSYMILALYIFEPTRRNQDFSQMVIVKTWNDEMPKDVNYLSYTDNKFIFNVYKTAKKMGQQISTFGPDLSKVINEYLQFRPKKDGKITNGTYFLLNYNARPLTQVNAITRVLNNIFKPKKVGASMLRHIFLSDKYGETLRQQKEDAEKMGHSLETQKEYIKLD